MAKKNNFNKFLPITLIIYANSPTVDNSTILQYIDSNTVGPLAPTSNTADIAHK